MASLSGLPAEALVQEGQTLTVNKNFTVLGQTALGETSIAGSLYAGGGIHLGSAGIDAFNDTLYIQKNKLANVDILNGTLVINTAGNVVINGDLAVTGNVAIGGVLGVNTITPLSDPNLTIDLEHASYASGSASGSGQMTSAFGKLAIRGAGGIEVASFDASGSALFAGKVKAAGVDVSADVVASGSGVFGKLVIGTDQTATESARQTAGQAILPARSTEIVINTNQVTQNSLIYITPLTSTNNQVLFVKTKIPGAGFSVAVDKELNTNIQFNWWIIN
jgi:hypothetical protein